MRKLATWAFSFAAGVFLAQYVLPKAFLPLLGGLLLLTAVPVGLRHRGAGLRAVLILLGLAAGLSYFAAYRAVVQLPAERLDGTEGAGVSMTLCGYAEETRYGAKVTVLLREPGLHGVRAVYYGDTELLKLVPGNVIKSDVSFGSAAVIRDEEITAFTSKRIFLLAYKRGEMTSGPGSADSPRWWPLRVGRAVQTRIGDLFSGDTAGFLTAILTGDKGGLSESGSNDLSEAGLYHILAVSGMHCSFLLAMVTVLAGRQRRRLIAAIASPLLAFYMLLTGGTPSVVRACIMLLFLLAAPLLRRDSDSPTALSAALLVILLQNPFAAASVSLQLSFGAVAGILWLTPKLTGLLQGHRINRVLRTILLSVSTTVGALLFTVPLTAIYFNTLTLVSPLSNLLCLWAASLVFCIGLLAVLASFLWMPLGVLLGLLPRVLIWYILRVSHALAALPYHALSFSNPYLKYWLGFAYLLFALAYFLRPRAVRKYAVAGVVAAAALCVSLLLGQGRYTSGELNITALNVGQGESVLLSSDGNFALIDCGSGNSWYDAGKIAADHLRGMGCGELDTLVLTHYDYDHVSGVTDLLTRIRVERMVLPETGDDAGLRNVLTQAAENAGTEIRYVTQKTVMTLGNARLTIYPPLGGEGDNEQGLSLLCTAGEYDLLATGDMNAETERKLLRTYRLPKIEALVAGHHGSKYSTSEDLVKALKPETAIVSVGSNSYGHPAEQTLRRLADAGCRVCRTDVQGDIHITVN